MSKKHHGQVGRIGIGLAAYCCVLLGGVQISQAALISLVNPSFEQDNVADGAAQPFGTPPTGWTFSSTPPNGNAQARTIDSSNASYANTTGSPGTLPGTADGQQFAFLNVTRLPPENLQYTGSTFLQTAVSPISIINNRIYTLTVAIGNPLQFDTGALTIALLANGIPQASFTVTAAQLNSAEFEGTFKDRSVSFQTLPSADPRNGQALSIRFEHSGTRLASQTDPLQVNVDNVRLDVVVPEPSLALSSMLAWPLFMRRARR